MLVRSSASQASLNKYWKPILAELRRQLPFCFSSTAGHPDTLKPNEFLETQCDKWHALTINEPISGPEKGGATSSDAKEKTKYRGSLLRLNRHRGSYLLEIYQTADTADSPPDLGTLARDIDTYWQAFQESETRLSAGWTPESSTSTFKDNIPKDWSLHAIEEALLTRLTNRLGDLGETFVKELHLFLLDPRDNMLYYAAADRLELRGIAILDGLLNGERFRIPRLSRERTEYVEKQCIERWEQLSGLPPRSLLDLYRTLQNDGLNLLEIHEQEHQLLDLLRCIPQESTEGVVGEAVSSETLTVGGERFWYVPTCETDRTFFTQKLVLEQLFGVASEGFLTAAPVHDAGQTIGAIFFVTAQHPEATVLFRLLDTAVEASDLLSQHRATRFLRSVISALEGPILREFDEVVEEHLGQLIAHEMLLVIEPQQVGPWRIRRAWATNPGEFLRSRIADPDIICSQLLTFLVNEFKAGLRCIEIPEVEWSRCGAARFCPNVPQTAILLEFNPTTYFVLLVAESPRRVMASFDKLQQKKTHIEIVASLYEAYKRRQKVAQFRNWAAFSSHSLRRRFADPLFDVFCLLENSVHALCASLNEENAIRQEIGNIEKYLAELALIQKLMNSQFKILSTAESRSKSVLYLDTIIRNEIPTIFTVMLRARDRATNVPYSERVTLDCTDIADSLPILGNEDDLLIAIVSILENCISDYAISRELVAENAADRCRVDIRACRDALTEHVCLYIRDYGLGMPGHLVDKWNRRLRRIAEGHPEEYRGFDPEFSSGKGQGTHIGLVHAATVCADCRSPLTDARGSLEIQTDSRSGTIFALRFPIGSRQ